MLFISYVDWKGLEDSDWCNRKESPKDGQRHFTLSQKTQALGRPRRQNRGQPTHCEVSSQGNRDIHDQPRMARDRLIFMVNLTTFIAVWTSTTRYVNNGISRKD